jgi:hypothetical protein
MPNRDPLLLAFQNPLIATVIGVIVLSWLFYIVQIARRKRERVKYKLKMIFVAETAFILTAIAFLRAGLSPLTSLIVAVLVGLGVASFIKPPTRTRRIPPHIKRAVIARGMKGERFVPGIHHIHHIVPFSRGGDNSIENLRVISKHENLRRGAKMPKIRDLF